MSEKTQAEDPKIIEVDDNPPTIKSLLRKHKKTLITVGVTAASTTFAILLARRDPDEDYDYDEEVTEEE